MYALWCILAISVLCESVAQKWQVWVCPPRISTLRSSADITQVCRKALCGHWCRIASIHHSNLRFRNRTHPDPWIALNSLQLLVCTIASVLLRIVDLQNRFSVGSLFAPVALQVMSTKDKFNFRTPIYTQASDHHGEVSSQLIVSGVILV
jgi:hypothetical protein